MVFVLLLVFDWGKSTKMKNKHLCLCSESGCKCKPGKISNNELEIYVDLRDGSIKMHLLWKQRSEMAYINKALSDDDLLRFYFRTNVSDFLVKTLWFKSGFQTP
ncbi:MAG: hypothetical protein CM15mP22_5680 [Gammaproteobacteria bacterium]|nr:MAG: hypothetical protein CM15mP22_5680 [Gammaproteobacteria bacterium]